MSTGGSRATVIAGNWKMYKGPGEARAFVSAFLELWQPRADRTVILFPSALSLEAAVTAAHARPDLAFGVQNIHAELEGAFTGENSAAMAVDAGARHALVGHSERRHVFGETDADVRRKVTAALAAGLDPVLCVGETLDERRAGRVDAVILRQLDEGLAEIGPDAVPRIMVAYEPVWAIGTGVNATPDDAAQAHATLRSRLVDRFGASGAAVPILYGGSVKPANAGELLAAPEVGGLLVGGASLEPSSFAAIAAA
jgi:triosephosphate isomerase (TIM)